MAVYGRDVAFMQEVKLGRLVGLKAGAASRAEVVAVSYDSKRKDPCEPCSMLRTRHLRSPNLPFLQTLSFAGLE